MACQGNLKPCCQQNQGKPPQKAVALNIMITVDKDNKAGCCKPGQNPKMENSEQSNGSCCKRSAQKQCCQSHNAPKSCCQSQNAPKSCCQSHNHQKSCCQGHAPRTQGPVPPPSLPPNSLVLPCGCVAMFDDAESRYAAENMLGLRSTSHAEVQCSPRPTHDKGVSGEKEHSSTSGCQTISHAAQDQQYHCVHRRHHHCKSKRLEPNPRMMTAAGAQTVTTSIPRTKQPQTQPPPPPQRSMTSSKKPSTRIPEQVSAKPSVKQSEAPRSVLSQKDVSSKPTREIPPISQQPSKKELSISKSNLVVIHPESDIATESVKEITEKEIPSVLNTVSVKGSQTVQAQGSQTDKVQASQTEVEQLSQTDLPQATRSSQVQVIQKSQATVPPPSQVASQASVQQISQATIPEPPQAASQTVVEEAPQIDEPQSQMEDSQPPNEPAEAAVEEQSKVPSESVIPEPSKAASVASVKEPAQSKEASEVVIPEPSKTASLPDIPEPSKSKVASEAVIPEPYKASSVVVVRDPFEPKVASEDIVPQEPQEASPSKTNLASASQTDMALKKSESVTVYKEETNQEQPISTAPSMVPAPSQSYTSGVSTSLPHFSRMGVNVPENIEISGGDYENIIRDDLGDIVGDAEKGYSDLRARASLAAKQNLELEHQDFDTPTYMPIHLSTSNVNQADLLSRQAYDADETFEAEEGDYEEEEEEEEGCDLTLEECEVCENEPDDYVEQVAVRSKVRQDGNEGFGLGKLLTFDWDTWDRFVSLINGEPIPNPCMNRCGGGGGGGGEYQQYNQNPPEPEDECDEECSEDEEEDEECSGDEDSCSENGECDDEEDGDGEPRRRRRSRDSDDRGKGRRRRRSSEDEGKERKKRNRSNSADSEGRRSRGSEGSGRDSVGRRSLESESCEGGDDGWNNSKNGGKNGEDFCNMKSACCTYMMQTDPQNQESFILFVALPLVILGMLASFKDC